MTIRSLFDPSKDIYRTIEKVITYGASPRWMRVRHMSGSGEFRAGHCERPQIDRRWHPSDLAHHVTLIGPQRVAEWDPIAQASRFGSEASLPLRIVRNQVDGRDPPSEGGQRGLPARASDPTIVIGHHTLTVSPGPWRRHLGRARDAGAKRCRADVRALLPARPQICPGSAAGRLPRPERRRAQPGAGEFRHVLVRPDPMARADGDAQQCEQLGNDRCGCRAHPGCDAENCRLARRAGGSAGAMTV